MIKNLVAVLLLCCAGICGAEFNPENVQLVGETNKSALSYAPGEEMVYKVKADLDGQSAEGLQIQWSRYGDDGKTMEGTVPADREAVVKTSLAHPGFVRVEFFLVDRNGKKIRRLNTKKKLAVGFFGGTAVEPEKLEDCGEPADFDEFWAKQKEKLAKVPFQGKVEIKKAKDTPGGTVYALKIPCAGPRPATAFLSIPKDATPRSLPIVVHFIGYGAKISLPPDSVKPGLLELVVNAHGQELLQPQAYYDQFFQSIRSGKYGYAFDPEQNKNPETAFFNGMVLRALRSLEYLKTRPEWDGKNIKVIGGSQGGLQTMWLTALDSDVSEAYPSITWCCDLAGESKKNRHFGNWRIPYVPALDYYDAAFMAKRIKTAKVEIQRAGLGDYTCPPSGLAICYKNLATPHKSIRWVQGSNHAFVPKQSEVIVWKK